MTGVNESQNWTQTFSTKIMVQYILGKMRNLEGDIKIDLEEAGC
jgi:hypothetical protein